MKKLMLLTVVAVFGLTSGFAQSYSAGVTVGLPIGDAGDLYTFNVGIDLDALWDISEEFEAGVATGYNHSVLDSDLNGDDFQYIPLAGAARYSASDDFVLGADLGYAIAVGDGDGGFYYRPMVGYNVSENTQITASYRGISVDGGSFSTVNLGVNFGL
ncbi:transporter [uncultured Psychroserpens sp.]|uniref:transporter n=1 Tax=uncultured Psychroserpens sp. TaxID=255436 RepID=UPI00260BA5BD|nr:transporter [uncultured Psychroserpens sp.]